MTRTERLVMILAASLTFPLFAGAAWAQPASAMATAEASTVRAAAAPSMDSAPGATVRPEAQSPAMADAKSDRGHGKRKWAHRDDMKEPPAVAIVVPISFFLFVFLVVAAVQAFSFRRDRHRHETLRLMVEKGAQIPVELISPPQRQGSDLRKGLILLGLGIGLSLFLLILQAPDKVAGVWSLGLIPALVGAGYLLVWKLEKRKNGETPFGR